MNLLITTFIAIIAFALSITRDELPSYFKSSINSTFKPDFDLKCARIILNISDEEFEAAKVIDLENLNENEKKEFWKLKFAFSSLSTACAEFNKTFIKNETSEEKIFLNCYKLKLSEIDPNSTFLKDFNPKSVDKNFCNSTIEKFDNATAKFRIWARRIKKDLNITSCNFHQFVEYEKFAIQRLETFVVFLGNFSIEDKIQHSIESQQIYGEMSLKKARCALRDLKLLP